MTTPTPYPMPAWWETVRTKANANVANAFILHFNVRDSIVPNLHLAEFLARYLAPIADIVVFYDRAHGVSLASPSMEKDFRLMAGLPPADQVDTGSSAKFRALLNQNEAPFGLNTVTEALQAIDRMLTYKPEASEADQKAKKKPAKAPTAAAIIFAAETIFPESPYNFMQGEDRTNLVLASSWGNNQAMIDNGNLVFLVADNLGDLHSLLRSAACKFEATAVDLPSYENRLAYAGLLANAYPMEWDVSLEEFARLTAGLNLDAMQDICLRGEQEGRLTIALIGERKDQIIKQEYEVLEIRTPQITFADIGGMEKIKTYFQNNVITPLRNGNYQRAPMGVMLAGPAGTGKTILAEAVAKEAGMNLTILAPAKLYNQYVGGTEQRLAKALRAIEALAPTLVFIDEVDTATGRGEGGDSGVGQRFFGALLEFMAQTRHRGKIVFIAATNRPDRIDAAMKRAGRFDAIIPVLLPAPAQRADIFNVQLRKFGITPTVGGKPYQIQPDDPCVLNTDRQSGAEIEAIVVKTLALIEDEGLPILEALDQAAMRLKPSTADVDFMTKIAVAACNDSDLLPAKEAKMLANRDALEAEIEAERPRRGRNRLL